MSLYSADAGPRHRSDHGTVPLISLSGLRLRVFTAIGIFLFFGAVMASLAATTLLWRGTALDRVWALNPMAYKQLAPLGVTSGFSSCCSV